MSSPAFEKNDNVSLDAFAIGTPASKPSSSYTGLFSRFSQWKADIGLINPGSVENLQKEVKSK